MEERDHVTMTPAKKTELAREALAEEIETVTWLTNQEIGPMGTVFFAKPSHNMGSISAIDLGGTHEHGVKRPEWHVAKPSERPARKRRKPIRQKRNSVAPDALQTRPREKAAIEATIRQLASIPCQR